MNSTAIGRIQCQSDPVPEVGSQPRLMEKTHDGDDGDPEVRGRGADQRDEGDDAVEEAADAERGERADDDRRDGDQRHGDHARATASRRRPPARRRSPAAPCAGCRRSRGAAGRRHSARTARSADRSGRAARGTARCISRLASTGRNSAAGSPVSRDRKKTRTISTDQGDGTGHGAFADEIGLHRSCRPSRAGDEIGRRRDAAPPSRVESAYLKVISRQLQLAVGRDGRREVEPFRRRG